MELDRKLASAEGKTILCYARTYLDEKACEHLKMRIRRGLDWQYLI